MRFLKTILGYSFVLLISLWLIAFFVFSSYAIGMKFRHLEKADAIVALTGGNDRIKESVRLLQEEYAPYLFISGVNENVTGYHLLSEIAPKWQEKVDLGHWAKTTRMNAIETSEWIHNKKISAIILVTSFYHMPRSLLEIKEAIPDLKIIPYAVFPQSFGESTDWLHTRYAWQLFLEYHKFLVVYFFKGAVK